MADGQLLHKETGKPVPAVADRMRHLQDCHGIGDFGIAKTLHIAQTTSGGGARLSCLAGLQGVPDHACTVQ